MNKETRTIVQTKVYLLVLNPMTDRAESGRIAAVSFDKQRLIDFYEAEKAEERYKDGRFQKTFKKLSPLEWYNPLKNIHSEDPEHFGQGLFEEWIQEENLDSAYFLIP